MAFIKSHSNYVLKNKHQTISDGTIWERDITTIGGVNQFSPGQVPIYKSGNFIITVRNDGKVANQYNKTKWKENESGDTWTLETISGMTSEFEDQNDVKIVLKQDYYDFCDFAYYGSLTELFRASINDILQRFPGELYVAYELDSSNNKTPINAYYTSGVTSDFEKVEESVILGGSDYTIVSNPFGIDIHSLKKPTDAKALKYFAEDGFKNYEIIDGDNENGTPITSWKSTPIEEKFCPGKKVADIKINDNIEIEAWVGDGNEIIYLTNNENLFGKHIRPSQSILSEFYNECDNFEKLILNRNTTPKYKSVFSVIHDNEMGYYRKTEEFIFPTSYGGYNVDATSFGFNDYTTRLAEIGAYYDEYFTDNLYRSMTHEAIKNFDWTYTREFTYGDEQEFVHGGEKMQKALRVFAREFDEILSYINNIKNYDRVTYDERSNTPDYFLIDEVENKGWDVCLIYPYDIKEFEADEFGDYKKDPKGNKIVISNKYDDEQFQLSGDSSTKFIRQFSQNTKKEVAPYRKELLDYPDGYFMTCCSGSGIVQTCQYSGSPYYFVSAKGSGTTYVDPCYKGTSSVKNRIKSYSNERTYTYIDANNEFMRRMVINSPYIWRHKGTVEGIEMILGMFGLRSKKWIESMPKYRQDCEELEPDYEITEYSSFTRRIEEKWDAIHQMYRIDWINSTKAIVYDYRSESNYTKYGAQPNYISYQGLPVSYRYEYLEYEKDENGNYVLDENGKKIVINNAYIKVDKLTACPQQETTSSVTEAFRVAETNEPVLRRYLYPNFNKDEQLDGNPYFQMNGGWLAKTVENSGGTRYNFQFDVNDNIAYTCYEESGRTEDDGSLVDNHPIYKETVRNVKRVDNIAELISTPITKLKYGTIYYVSHVEKDVALINNQVYPIKYEYSGDNTKPSRYILLTKNSEYIKVGDDRFFDKEIFVYDKTGEKVHYDVASKPVGYEVKAYIKNDDTFICQGDEDGFYTIDSFCILENALPSEGFTNYFIIDNPYYCNRIANVNENEDSDNNGWRALKETDPEYIKINTIRNYYEGNNPHNGNMDYDSGHEYFTYFKRLFKNPIDESLFDERCYESFFVDLDNEIQNIGFSNLIEDNELIKQYTPFISADTKVHYFGSYYKRTDRERTPAKKPDCSDGEVKVKFYDTTQCTDVKFYGEDKEKIEELGKMYKFLNKDIKVDSYILSDDKKILGKSYPYSGVTKVEYKCGDRTYSVPVDEVTNQIMNNKRLTIKFNLHEKWYSEQGQCELKYLDDIVMNYLTQMIPSTTIVDIQYYGTYDECGYLSVGSTSETWEYNDTTSKDIAIISAYCISSISANSLEHFNVTLGSGKVTVSPKGENTSDSAYVEKVKISYSADSTSCYKEITLTQKVNSCTPSTCVCYKVSQATLKGGTSIGSGDTSAEVEWTYTAITWTTNATCKITSAETTGTSSHTVTGIEVNNTCSDIVRSGSFTWTGHKACGSNNECTDNGSVINWSVTQDRGKSETDPECSGCYCSGFTIGSAPSAWNCNETNNKYVPYTADTCIANITASVNNSHFAVSVDTPNTRISVKPTSLNTTTSNITATVTVSFNSGVNTCESKTFQVVHNSGSSCSCNCDDFSIGYTPSAWKCDETDNKYVPYTADTCITNIAASADNAHFTTSVDTSNNRISVKPNDLNTTTSNITATVTVSFNSGVNTCESKTFQVVHNSGSSCSCSCSDLTVSGITDATSTTVASGGGNSNLASYTASCATIGQVTFSDSWITNIGVSNGRITGTVATNCSSTERSGTLTIPYSAGYSTCTSKTVTIKQSAGGLTIVADKEIDCHGGTVTFSV